MDHSLSRHRVSVLGAQRRGRALYRGRARRRRHGHRRLQGETLAPTLHISAPAPKGGLLKPVLCKVVPLPSACRAALPLFGALKYS